MSGPRILAMAGNRAPARPSLVAPLHQQFGRLPFFERRELIQAIGERMG